ncbi:MAG: uracil-DNA glycosylase [Bacteroidales bacterium]|nr:uracil-DNA glycosylase [Bacteroidales bacterium]
MNVRIDKTWQELLSEEFSAPYFKTLTDFVRQEYSTTTIYPPASLIFNAFDHCPVDKVRVVILGQDPYHEPYQAMGLSFSVPKGVMIPRSLQNIYKEIQSDIGHISQTDGDLTRWADQGVLLLNATLTVRAHAAASHQGRGWELFTDNVVRRLQAARSGLVFMLWGAYAGRKAELIDRERHLILTAAHPSPLSASRGFFGCKHFSKANEYLVAHGESAIEW